jgi:deoxycytidylate deaminase
LIKAQKIPKIRPVREKLLKRAVQIAKNLCPVNKEMRSSHVAFLIKSNTIEKIGTNKRRTHPEISKHPYHDGHVGIHAELDCILKMDKEDLSSYKMLVLRIDRHESLTMSKPCSGCQSFLSQFNLKEIWYSDKSGHIIQM